jgi:hypothetical protein
MQTSLRLIVAVALLCALPAGADPPAQLKVQPFTFADVSGDFGPPVNPSVVSAKWVNKQGTTSTPTTQGSPADFGLVLTKQTATSTAAASGAVLKGPEGAVVTLTTEFDYAYRSDGHCGAGAPRFNVTVTDGTDSATYAVGCANPATITTPINASWTAKTWTPANFFFLNGNPLVLLVGSTIESVAIVFDEGTDVGPGKAILDDVSYNGLVAGGPSTTK